MHMKNNEKFPQIDTTIFDVDVQTLPKYPK